MVLRKMLCGTLLITDNNPTFIDKLIYAFAALLTLSPIVFILNQITIWFSTNRKFATLIVLVILINLFVGVWYHLKMRTFSWEEFLFKNCIMVAILILSYTLLESLVLIVGNNMIAEGFRVTIQLATLFYPASKALKNLYILSNKEFPPAFIMEKLYKFEQTGDIAELYKTTYERVKTTTTTITDEFK